MKQKYSFLIVLLSIFAGSLMAQTDFMSTTPTAMPSQYEPAQRGNENEMHTARGNFMIGTGIGFSSSNSKVNVNTQNGTFSGDGGSSSQLNFSPSIGYFFANNFTFGVGMDLIASRTSSQKDITDPDSPKQTSENSNVLFGPFARLYVTVSDDKAFFLGSTLGFGSSRDQYLSDGGNNQTINNNIITVGIGPGFTVFSNSGLALEALVKYNYARSGSDINLDNVTRKSVTRTHAFDFSVGLQYYFSGFHRYNQSPQQTVQPGRF